MPDPRDFRRPVERPAMLLVEGMDEFALLCPFLEHMGVTSIDIRLYDGTANLGRRLKSLKITSDFAKLRALGVLRDADENAASALQSVQGALERADLAYPEAAGDFAEGKPSVGVLVVPGAGNPGSLETLCWPSKAGLARVGNDNEEDTTRQDLVPACDVANCVGSYIKCLQDREVRLHRNVDKVRVHTYLAAHRQPGMKIGEAAAAGCWDFTHDAWGYLRKFIQTMNQLSKD